MPPAAGITGPVSHPLPPILMPGPGAPTVPAGFLPAWRAIPAAAAGVMAARRAIKAAVPASMSGAIMSASAGAGIHACMTPSPVPPHRPGVVADGSPTVMIDNLPASRMGDTIIEPLVPPNKIVKGEVTAIIGQSGQGGSFQV